MRERGFTLIELSLVIVALGIVAAFVVHGIGRSAPGLGLRQEATKIASEVSMARALAIAEQRSFRLELVGGREMRVLRSEGGGWRRVRGPSAFRDDVRVSIDGASTGFLEFLYHGRVVAPATIEVSNTHGREMISVWASGAAKRWRP